MQVKSKTINVIFIHIVFPFYLFIPTVFDVHQAIHLIYAFVLGLIYGSVTLILDI